jgi:hypothetical protein
VPGDTEAGGEDESERDQGCKTHESRLVPLLAMHDCLSPAITRRQSPPSPSPRQTSLAAVECGLWLGAHDREASQHHQKGH